MRLVTPTTTMSHLEASRVEVCFRAHKVISQTAHMQTQTMRVLTLRTLQQITRRKQISQGCRIQAQPHTTQIIQLSTKLGIPQDLNRQLYHRVALWLVTQLSYLLSLASNFSSERISRTA
jgi:hypothetical protein